jgi:hypothetical protein
MPAPLITPSAATDIDENWGTVHASLNPNGSDTSWHVDFGYDASYGLTSSVMSALSSVGVQSISQQLTQLQPGSLIYWRISATNSSGATTAVGTTFSTTALPSPLEPVDSDDPVYIATAAMLYAGGGGGRSWRRARSNPITLGGTNA